MATDETDGFRRFVNSAKKYKVPIKVGFPIFDYHRMTILQNELPLISNLLPLFKLLVIIQSYVPVERFGL